MNKETIMKVFLPVAAVVASVGVGFAGITSAETLTSGASATQTAAAHVRGIGMRQGVSGKVTAVSGTTLTVSSTDPKTSVVTTYTVDASAATFKKSVVGSTPTSATIADIAVGDTVAIRGTVSGTSVKATVVMDGIVPHMGMGGPGGRGHGEGIGGTVTAVSGTTVTVTGKDGKTYTIDGTSAKVSKISTIAVGDIKVGDTIGARGTLSGTTVTANDIIDGILQGPSAK